MKDALVVYYSRGGRTRRVALELAKLLNADVEEIREPTNRSGALGLLRAALDALVGRPACLVSTHSTEGRRTIVLGSPIWAFGLPPAVRAYLRQVELSGLKVCVFVTCMLCGGRSALRRVGKRSPDGIATSLILKSPSPKDPYLDDRIRSWAEEIRRISGQPSASN